MTASVRDLLDGIHARAWELAGAEPPAAAGLREAGAAGLLVVWPRLAASTLRALDAVPLAASKQDDVAAVRDSLAGVVHGRVSWRELRWSVEHPVPDREVLGIALRVGAIADLLVGQPRARLDGDEAAGFGLQANLLAPVFAVATTTLAALEGLPGVEEQRRLLRRILAGTERYALVGGVHRSGRYDDLGVAAPGEVSLDGVIGRWVSATTQALGSRHGVTGIALQVAAGDVLIVTAAAASVCGAAGRLGVVDAGRAELALAGLAAANAAWRDPARWPPTIRLDGARSLEQTGASRQLRQMFTDALRQERGWLPAEVLGERFDLGVLLATMRRGMHAAGNVALAHVQAVENLVHGRDQLWIAAKAITDPAFQSREVVEAARRHGWVPMPCGDATGIHLLQAAGQALTATTVALAAFDRTAAAPATVPDRAGRSLGLEQGRIVAHLRGVPRPVERIASSEPAGVRAERRTPIAMTDPPGLGPRR